MLRSSLHRTACFLLAGALLTLPFPGNLAADSLSDQRARIGIDLFLSLLAAQDGISGKADSDGAIHLLLIHAGRKHFGDEMAERLTRVKEIRGIPIRVSIVHIRDLTASADLPAAGIFLTEPLGKELETVIRLARDRHAVLFSPFPGDVEQGVASGILITDRILPYVNTEALRLSGIQIRPFFLGIAKQYGD